MRFLPMLFAGVAGLVLLAAVGGSLLLAFPETVLAEDAVTALGGDPGIQQWGFAAAAVSAGLSAENPELMGRVLVMVGLAEGIAIYGLIVSILILNRLG